MSGEGQRDSDEMGIWGWDPMMRRGSGDGDEEVMEMGSGDEDEEGDKDGTE